ncbi:MAG: Maf-like protein [Allorhizobium sp.]
MATELVLASTSQSRRTLMKNAGLIFEAVAADVDERAIEAEERNAKLGPAELALELARRKALDVSRRKPGALVVGCDQTMSLDQIVFHKPAGVGEARGNLWTLRGKTHRLNSAIVLVRDGEVSWEHVGIAELTMRPFSESYLDLYLSRVAGSVLKSVGAYQLEGEGIQLFESIEGDYFTILGLPLLPLLSKLRELGILHA